MKNNRIICCLIIGVAFVIGCAVLGYYIGVLGHSIAEAGYGIRTGLHELSVR